jgi:predicted nucleic acid-binding protein
VIVVVDGSVAIKWFVSVKPDEEHADRALRILEQTVRGSMRMVQPPHFIAEVVAVLARLKPDVVQEDLFDLLHIEHQTLDTPQTYATAVTLATRHQLHLFDTLYHAVALQTPGATLVTSDARYFAKARAEGRIALLSELDVA